MVGGGAEAAHSSTQHASPKEARSPGRPKNSPGVTKIKDKNAPKGPRSAYLHFLSTRRDYYVREHKELKYNDVLAAVAVEWSKLPDEQKKVFFDQAAEDRERYKREFQEYQKTSAYREFEAKKKDILKQQTSKGETGQRKRHADDDAEEEVPPSALQESDIPIFSNAFLEYNKAQERRLKEIRRSVSSMDEEGKLLKKEIGRLEGNIVAMKQHRLDDEITHKCVELKAKWEKLLASALSNVTLPGVSPSSKNMELYMARLREIVTKNPNDALLGPVRSALSHVDFISS